MQSCHSHINRTVFFVLKIMPQLLTVVVHTLMHGGAILFDTVIFYDARKPLVVFGPVDLETLSEFFGRIFNGGL